MHAPASPSPDVVHGQPFALPQSTLASATLLHVLRNDLALNGPKYGCGLGQCGACTVLVDGVAARACVIPARGVAGRQITTLEGLRSRHAETAAELHPVQQAFIDEAAVQCGFCTPGFIMSATELLNAGKEFSDDEIRKMMSGHLCRCTGYENIFRAVKKTMLRRLGKNEEADAV